jgi:hypothetical protein
LPPVPPSRFLQTASGPAPGAVFFVPGDVSPGRLRAHRPPRRVSKLSSECRDGCQDLDRCGAGAGQALLRDFGPAAHTDRGSVRPAATDRRDLGEAPGLAAAGAGSRCSRQPRSGRGSAGGIIRRPALQDRGPDPRPPRALPRRGGIPRVGRGRRGRPGARASPPCRNDEDAPRRGGRLRAPLRRRSPAEGARWCATGTACRPIG